MAPRKKKDETILDVNVSRTPEQTFYALRRKVENFYDLQRLRKQTEGRTYDRAKNTEIKLHEVDVAILERRASELEVVEGFALNDVEDHLKTIPFYVNILSDKKRYKGIGPTMAGVILSYFDIRKADTPSKFWSYAGLSVIPAVRCANCHAVLKEKTDKNNDVSYAHPPNKKCDKQEVPVVYQSGKAPRPVSGEKLKYNKFLRAKMCGVLGAVLIKLNSPWRKFYDEYKHRKASCGWGESDLHRHKAAVRYMIKMLLLDIWTEWRKHEKLPVRPSYHEEKQGGHGFRVKVVEGAPIEFEWTPEIAAELKNLKLETPSN